MSLILDGTNGLSDVDGTAAAPAIRGTDTNTGIFFGADIIGFAEGGVECARFNADAQFVAAAGTAALPVITTTGDVNTGIFFPAADTIAFSEGGTEAMRIDSSGNVLVTNAAGLGYGTGAGGTVTQATSKGTAVTLNKPTGQVTTNNAALASGATVSFSINNSIISATDVVVVVVSAGSSYTVQPAFVQAGVFNIRLTNTTGGSLSEAVVINFAVIKGATS